LKQRKGNVVHKNSQGISLPVLDCFDDVILPFVAFRGTIGPFLETVILPFVAFHRTIKPLFEHLLLSKPQCKYFSIKDLQIFIETY
jgi:hypothetical protein